MFFSTINDSFRRLGLVNGVLYATDRLLRRLSQDRVRIIRYYFYAQPVQSEESRSLRASNTQVIREVAPSDPVVEKFPRPPRIIAQRFANGARCYVIEDRNHFAGYIWLAYKGYDEDEVRCRYDLFPENQCVWDFDVYIKPEFRMGRAFARLWDTTSMQLATQDIHWSCSRISAFNPQSVAAHKRLGAQPLFSATFICFGAIQISLIGIPPFAHISFLRTQRPALKIQAPPEKR